jgi:membrane protein insertase Oxa1/YidC/SpoIIIJ
MSIKDILYFIFISPLLSIYQIIFLSVNSFTKSPGVTIVFFSVIINLILLPIYYQMEKKGTANLNLQNEMKKEIQRIKKNYKGRERYFYLKTIYKYYNFSPFYVLFSSTELYLQILVFMTVYNYLSQLKWLNGIPFLFIKNLGHPDKLLFGMNALPIIMTIANLVSATFYTKDKSKRTQAFVMALVFLALLYNSTSALVLYWTSNNIFSLIKNWIQFKIFPRIRIIIINHMPNLFQNIQKFFLPSQS